MKLLFTCKTILGAVVCSFLFGHFISCSADQVQLDTKGFGLHRQNFVLPATWSNRAEKTEDIEFRFQFSIRQRVFDLPFYVAYTQKSFWRIFDRDDSSPFRETNYNPEFFFRLMPEINPIADWWGFDIGYEHESNGSRIPTSRSWDRLYFTPFLRLNSIPLFAAIKVWYRFPEDAKSHPEDPSGDDNPDIEDFYGYGQLQVRYGETEGHTLVFQGRWNMKTGKHGFQVDYTIPGPGNLNFFVHFWTGYGESLIDYNHYITRGGLGIAVRWGSH